VAALQGVVNSTARGGDELFTFLRLPQSQWKALGTTNAPERINRNFAEKTKTQASLSGGDTGLLAVIWTIAQRADRTAPHRWAARHGKAKSLKQSGTDSGSRDNRDRQRQRHRR
jgi:transposase-like protein